MYFKSFVGGPDNLFYQLNFLFQLKGKDIFCVVVVLFSFVGYYFLSNVNMVLA